MSLRGNATACVAHALLFTAAWGAGAGARAAATLLDAVHTHVASLASVRAALLGSVEAALQRGWCGAGGRAVVAAVRQHPRTPYAGPPGGAVPRALLSGAGARPGVLCFSFAGCSWLLLYHVGVAAALQERLPRRTLARAHWAGTSSGALVAAAMAADVPARALRQLYWELLAAARSSVLGPTGRMTALVRRGLAKLLPADAARRAGRRLTVTATAVLADARQPPTPGGCETAAGPSLRLGLFGKSWDHFAGEPGAPRGAPPLVDALLASCYIPLYYETPTVVAGVLHLDGGLTNNQPMPAAHTVTVSPVAGAAAISPARAGEMPAHWRLFPPARAAAQRMFEAGHRDAMRWLAAHGVA